MSAPENVTIVGGSLSGLTLALAYARRGIGTRVLEQAQGARRRGGTLGIDRAQLLRIIGKEARHNDGGRTFPLLAGRRRAVAWQVLYDWPRTEARRQPAIVLEEGVAIIEIEEDGNAAVAIAEDSRCFSSRLVIGADGYRSFIRQTIDPDRHQAVYAGYLLWRGLVDEAELLWDCLPREHDEAVLINEAGHRLVAHSVASTDGALELGRRLLSFTWYDGGRIDLLRELSCVSHSGHVLCTLTEEHIPAEVRAELCELACYFPRCLCKGSLAIIGDAAHTVSLATGQGFVAGVRDAGTLAECLADAVGSSDQWLHAALALYERRRLADVQALVLVSRKWSRAFVEEGLAAAS